MHDTQLDGHFVCISKSDALALEVRIIAALRKLKVKLAGNGWQGTANSQKPALHNMADIKTYSGLWTSPSGSLLTPPLRVPYRPTLELVWATLSANPQPLELMQLRDHIPSANAAS